ncbi:MAG: tetratricopeptide repeat protein [Desulfobacterales bacterium]|nr:tetratricopeptide repeat protein [Desulfobacterales bacterium]
MRRNFTIFFILISVIFFCACASNNTIKKKPKYLIFGMKEINKGTLWYQKGCYKRALEHFFRAHELFTAFDHIGGIAMSMNNIGNIYRMLGDTQNALLFFEESFSLYSDVKDYKGMLQCLSNKAAALIEVDRLSEATEVINLAEEIVPKIGKSFVPLLNNRGILLIKKKEYGRAEEFLKQALANTNSTHLSEFATVNFSLGRLMFTTERYEKAISYLNAALDSDRLLGFHKGIADDLAVIGSVYLCQIKNKLAINFFKRSIKIYALIGAHEKVSIIMAKMQEASKQTDIDSGVTEHFINNWLDGNIFEEPCK